VYPVHPLATTTGDTRIGRCIV